LTKASLGKVVSMLPPSCAKCALQRRTGAIDSGGLGERATTHERNEILKLAIERVEVKGTGRPKQVAISWTGWLEQAAA
jgi:hypothetical protein